MDVLNRRGATQLFQRLCQGLVDAHHAFHSYNKILRDFLSLPCPAPEFLSMLFVVLDPMWDQHAQFLYFVHIYPRFLRAIPKSRGV
jgi:hypothetical protein